MFFGREDIPLVRDVVQHSRFDALGETISTNVVVKQLLWEKLEADKLGMVLLKERAFRNVTNAIDVTLVRLNRGTNVFVRPMQLKPNHEYWVVKWGLSPPGRPRRAIFREGYAPAQSVKWGLSPAQRAGCVPAQPQRSAALPISFARARPLPVTSPRS